MPFGMAFSVCELVPAVEDAVVLVAVEHEVVVYLYLSAVRVNP